LNAYSQRVGERGRADATAFDLRRAQVKLQAPAGSPFSTSNIVLSSLTIPGGAHLQAFSADCRLANG
jgi:hypothetical protein